MQSGISDTRRRVKVYQLNDDRQWDDRGTGHVSTTFSSQLDDSASLMVKSETDGTILLDSEIRNDTNYSKQQETLIVWSEDNSDLALSFQEKNGCEEIWERICQQQGRDPEANDTIASSEEEPDDELELPAPELTNINSIRECFATHYRLMRREKLSAALKSQGYIPKLLELFRMCEDLDNKDALRTLYEIFKSIWMLNQGEIYEILFKPEHIFDVVGVMEYDPSRKDQLKHREFLNSIANFKNVLPIGDETLRKKINQTYRMQYVQESVLPAPSMFEQDNLSTLASFVFFSKVDIVKMVMKEPNLIETCLTHLKNKTTAPRRQVELCGFLKEFFTYSQNLQQPEKENFLEMLLHRGILNAIEVLLDSEYSSVRTLGAELICQITELNQQPSVVREHILKSIRTPAGEPAKKDLMNLLLNVMLNDPDPELGTANQLTNTIRILLDPENMLRSSTEKADFLGFFYRECMTKLTNFLTNSTTSNSIRQDDYKTAHSLVLILELLMFMVEHHTYHIRNHILHRDTLKRALLLVQSRHTFLALSALRLLRKIIGKADETYNRLIIQRDLLQPIIDAIHKNGRRYNLLNSALLELFKHIKDENTKPLISYIVEKYWDKLQNIKYTQVFDQIKEKNDQSQMERRPGNNSETGSWRLDRFRPDPRQVDDDESSWFSDDEDKNEKPSNRALVDYQDSDSDGEVDKDGTPKVQVEDTVQTNVVGEKRDSPTDDVTDIQNVKRARLEDSENLEPSTEPKPTTELTTETSEPVEQKTRLEPVVLPVAENSEPLVVKQPEVAVKSVVTIEPNGKPAEQSLLDDKENIEVKSDTSPAAIVTSEEK